MGEIGGRFRDWHAVARKQWAGQLVRPRVTSQHFGQFFDVADHILLPLLSVDPSGSARQFQRDWVYGNGTGSLTFHR